MLRIRMDPEIQGGAPCVAGTDVRVGAVLNLVERGHTYDEIIRCWPQIMPADIRACLRYAHRGPGRTPVEVKARQESTAYRTTFWYDYGMLLLLAGVVAAMVFIFVIAQPSRHTRTAAPSAASSTRQLAAAPAEPLPASRHA